jgi:hypothetical protein
VRTDTFKTLSNRNRKSTFTSTAGRNTIVLSSAEGIRCTRELAMRASRTRVATSLGFEVASFVVRDMAVMWI